jgi:tRNA nucleotidyltransferase/poly(A) polymerase
MNSNLEKLKELTNQLCRKQYEQDLLLDCEKYVQQELIILHQEMMLDSNIPSKYKERISNLLQELDNFQDKIFEVKNG